MLLEAQRRAMKLHYGDERPLLLINGEAAPGRARWRRTEPINGMTFTGGQVLAAGGP